MTKRRLELLAPAANAEVAIQAVLHGADAVYMGASSHGARKEAANTIEDIRKVVDFAHQYRVKVYVTVNTIVYESEIDQVKKLCESLYNAGVDALIVQDMALLNLNLPPIALHASTQCDIRTPSKAEFLQEAGFSQLVLARELTLDEIKSIVNRVKVPVECFVHGALCVSYSGRCHASYATLGRSANRGECAQICRMPYTLRDNSGKVIAENKYLLSLHDFNASDRIENLINAGVSSFKIEGRLKDANYVKNVVAYYRKKIDDVIEKHPEEYVRSSFGKSIIDFTPNLSKSFNRGFTDYFLSSRRPLKLASMMTPKSMGEVITDINDLNNGDGISYFDRKGNYCGLHVNRVEGGRIMAGRKIDIPTGAVIHRTSDLEWKKLMSRPTAKRKIALRINMDNNGVTAEDERGVRVRVILDVAKDKSQKKMDYQGEFSKLGNTVYELETYNAEHDNNLFIPRSEISNLRRKLVALLDAANLATYPFDKRRPENPDAIYPADKLDFRDNVSNSLAEQFYRRHGVKEICSAMETSKTAPAKGTVVMTTRHCILRELGMCRKAGKTKSDEPLRLCGGPSDFILKFNCRDCEMEVLLASGH